MIAPTLLLLAGTAAPAPQNVLLLIADDVGVDRIGAYAASPDPGHTPNIDGLAAEGVLFRNVWSNPICSPTRATILTGRYGFRTGIGNGVGGVFGAGTPGSEESDGTSLPLSEWTLPEALRAQSGNVYSSLAVGKWHLAAHENAALHPLHSGFDHHAGSLLNFSAALGESYFAWPKLTDGVPAHSTVYATTDTVDDAIVAVESLPEPWFLWVAFNASHGPFHAPPEHLHTFELDGAPGQSVPEHMKAMTEAMDTEIGRLLGHLAGDLRERTTIVFVSDNGTPKKASDTPTLPGKTTLYQRGIHVPLIVAGPSVAGPGRECAALVNTTDLYATVLDLADLPVPQTTDVTDSVSLAPYLEDPDATHRRATVFAERFKPNGFGPYELHHMAVRGERYKLIRKLPADTEELFDLVADPAEESDLLEAASLAPEAAAATPPRRAISWRRRRSRRKPPRPTRRSARPCGSSWAAPEALAGGALTVPEPEPYRAATPGAYSGTCAGRPTSDV